MTDRDPPQFGDGMFPQQIIFSAADIMCICIIMYVYGHLISFNLYNYHSTIMVISSFIIS